MTKVSKYGGFSASGTLESCVTVRLETAERGSPHFLSSARKAGASSPRGSAMARSWPLASADADGGEGMPPRQCVRVEKKRLEFARSNAPPQPQCRRGASASLL